ncbi:glycosyltransferase family 2 protein [Aliarcobacter butzleri]|uniref:glycosyltransferase family 2 protein n=1 Tax=Aliarcobacter butzleri TaxID=28197 RepID=UPI00263CAC93|nr:glycosyltransferase family 2 protein [Aliarcobacter butzleri]MDN5097931.1 glycosyltransferase family 2 protein [Aliarcobacter butzleri]
MKISSENKPIVSIVIPMYNAEVFISETINSVLKQSFAEFELIIIDNSSTDNSKGIVKDFIILDNRIKLIELEYNSGGPARPRNIGIENAKGEYIAFLDADDVWDINKLAKQIKFLRENNIEFTSTDCMLIDDKNKEIKLKFLSKIYNKFIKKKTICDVIKNNFILTSSVLVKKTLLKKFEEDKRYIAVEDFDMWLYILANNENIYKYQNEKLILYRVLENSVSNRKNILNQELKANLVLANFILKHEKYLSCYLYRQFFHIIIKQIRTIFK